MRWIAGPARAIGRGARAIGRGAKAIAGEVLIVAAIGAISAGAWRVYEPAGLIAGGLLTGALGFLLLPLGSQNSKRG